MNLVDTIKVIAVTIPVASAATYALDRVGLRPVVTYELERQGWYMERQRLIDRKKDGTMSDFERGILFGLCRAMRIKTSDCDKEDG